MLILKSQSLNDGALIEYARSLSTQSGGIEQQLLHWSFGPMMTMRFDAQATNYLFSDEKVPFHWDGAFFREPMKLLFFCTESEGEGGETIFSHTGKIWEAMSPNEKKICQGIRLKYRTEKVAHYGGEIDIPLVQKHPISGRTILRWAEKVETELNPVSIEIQGTSDPQAFYEDMTSRLYQKEFLTEHSWEIGDLLVVDNFTYVHGRNALRSNRKRTFKRIQIL